MGQGFLAKEPVGTRHASSSFFSGAGNSPVICSHIWGNRSVKRMWFDFRRRTRHASSLQLKTYPCQPLPRPEFGERSQHPPPNQNVFVGTQFIASAVFQDHLPSGLIPSPSPKGEGRRAQILSPLALGRGDLGVRLDKMPILKRPHALSLQEPLSSR